MRAHGCKYLYEFGAATETNSTAGASGVTLFPVESNRPGFTRERNLEKLGVKAQDTSELFFAGRLHCSCKASSTPSTKR